MGTGARPAAVSGASARRLVRARRAHRGCGPLTPLPAPTKPPLAPLGPVPRAPAPHPPEAPVLRPSRIRPTFCSSPLPGLGVSGTAPPQPCSAGGGSGTTPANSSPGSRVLPGQCPGRLQVPEPPAPAAVDRRPAQVRGGGTASRGGRPQRLW